VTGIIRSYTPDGTAGTIFGGPNVGTVIETADNVQLIGFNIDGDFSGAGGANIGVLVEDDTNVNLWDLEISDLGSDADALGTNGGTGETGAAGTAGTPGGGGGAGGVGGGAADAPAYAAGIRIDGSKQIFLTDVTIEDVVAQAGAAGGSGGMGG